MAIDMAPIGARRLIWTLESEHPRFLRTMVQTGRIIR
jgi:hypothetical protein